MTSDEVAKRIRDILAEQKLKIDYICGDSPLYMRARNAHRDLSELAEMLEKEVVIESLKGK